MRFRDFIDILINPIWKWVVEIFMGLLSIIIYIKPEWTTWLSFSNLIVKYWWIWFVVGTIIWGFSTAWQYAKEKAEMRKAIELLENSKPSETYHVETGVGKQSANEIKNYFGKSEDSKKKDDLERLSKPKIDFSPRWKHFDDIVIEGSTPKQIMTIIQADGMGNWFLHLVVDEFLNKFAYDVSYEETNFYDPDKDNTLLDGGTFSTIKYRLGTKEGGVLTRTQIQKIQDMFAISIAHSGVGNAIKSTVRFDTNYPDAIGFHDRLKEELSKQFTVIKDTPLGLLEDSLFERIPVHILSPAIMIENNDHRDWKNCRLVIDKVDEKSAKERFCWSEALSIGQINYMVDCLDGEKIFSSLEFITNQNALRKIAGNSLSNDNFLSGICEIYATFYASTVSGEFIRREVYIKAEFSDNVIPTKYGKIINVKVLEVR